MLWSRKLNEGRDINLETCFVGAGQRRGAYFALQNGYSAPLSRLLLALFN